jgi:hypothetical protein
LLTVLHPLIFTTQNSEQAVNNGNLKPFRNGQSGNPGGRPKEVAEVKALARTHTITAIETLVKIAARGLRYRRTG